jgi:hypothetical protein
MNPCEGCAYTEGAAANLEPQNKLNGQLCVLGGIPFYCHHTKSGEIIDLGHEATNIPEVRRELVQSGKMVICQGWKRETEEIARTGYYDRARDLKRAFALLGLGSLQIFITTDDEAKKRVAARNLRNVILALNRSRGFSEVNE